VDEKELKKEEGFLDRFTRFGAFPMAIAVLIALGILMIPLPTHLVDLLLTFSITLALTILLVTMFVERPLYFSSFPSLLLIVTLFRLALNVATTRLILLQANAGEVIQAFGQFVVGGNYIVGAVIFLILVIINIRVITSGATRIAEVAARFTLDAMPGKQMSIDADLNTGLITEDEARERRAEIAREADFYGAMDGASKFIRGDAIAGLIITAINIVGGIILGVFQLGMPLRQALATYTILTIGDGLVSQIPAIIVSTGAGILVTRSAAEADLGAEVTKQLLHQPQATLITAGMLAVFGIVPGLPTLPFFVLAILMGILGYSTRTAKRQLELKIQQEEEKKAAEVRKPEKIEHLLQVDPLELEIGYGLIPLVDTSQQGDLLERITVIRRQQALEMGIVVPPIRIRDNIQLKPHEYVIKIKGVETARYELVPDHLLAMNPGTVETPLEGIPTKEPAFGMSAIWIPVAQKEQAELAEYTVVEPSAVIATHLTEVIKNNAADLLGRQDVKQLLDNLKEKYPAVVEELVPNIMSIGGVQKILQNLLRERISIRDLVTILEALADYAQVVKNLEQLTELVRQSLARSISRQFADSENRMHVITMDPKLEEEIQASIETREIGEVLTMNPRRIQKIIDSLTREVEKALAQYEQAILLCSASIRHHVRRFTSHVLPHLAVLSYNEIVPGIHVESVGMVEVEDEG